MISEDRRQGKIRVLNCRHDDRGRQAGKDTEYGYEGCGDGGKIHAGAGVPLGLRAKGTLQNRLATHPVSGREQQSQSQDDPMPGVAFVVRR